MTKKVLISATEQYIINKVRAERLELNITAETLSIEVSPSKSPTYIGNIESSSSSATYTDDILNMVAIYFTTVSKKNYTIYSFYPRHIISDSKVTKEKVGIPKESGPTGTLNAILEMTNYFNIPRSTKEITEYCNSFFKKEWKTSNFTSPIDYAVKTDKLKRLELADGSVKYQQL